jgi:hypothetical protein
MKHQLLHTEKLRCHNPKVFFVDLQENERGRVVNITEEVNGMRDRIMVPLENLGEFIAALVAVGKAAEKHHTPPR